MHLEIPLQRTDVQLSRGRARRPGLTALVSAASASALALTGAIASPAAADPPTWVALPNPNTAETVGTTAPLDPTESISLRVYLSGQNPTGRVARALTVSDPRNPAYAHYLTPAEYQRRYGPTPAQTDAVSSWLTATGMTITASSAHYIAVTATVAQADAAFNTQISSYTSTHTETIHGHTFTYTISVPGAVGGFSAPAALGADVTTVTGLDEVAVPNENASAQTEMKTPATAPVPSTSSTTNTSTSTPTSTSTAVTTYQCSQYWGQYTETIPAAYGHTTAPTQLCGYTVQQMRQAYGIASSRYTGKGSTVAVVLDGHSPTMLADANEFFAAQGVAGFAPGQYTEDIGPNVDASCAGNFDPLEESIDVESTHIAAPDAKVVYVAANCRDAQSASNNPLMQNWLDALTRVVDRHLADVATGSWGLVEPSISPADTAAWDPLLQQGALEGIGFDFSSGDGGDGANPASSFYPGNPPETQFPAVDPWVTAVGGTSLEIGANGRPVGDPAWGDNATESNSVGDGYTSPPPGSFLQGSGGGVSTFYAEPAYQRSAVPAALATGNGTAPAARVVPDVSANAGNNWLIGFTGAINTGVYDTVAEAGGTSGSSPLIAGLEADAIQAAGHPLGFANPALYQLQAKGSPAIRDVKAVNPADPPIVFGAQLGVSEATDFLTTFGEDSSLQTATGYDDATGLGAATDCFVTAFNRF
jgi:subtilase family serine protease